MKTILISLIGALTIGATLPAFAGPDWQVIEKARKDKLVQLQQTAPSALTPGHGSAGSSQQDESTRDKLMKECMDMMKKSS